MAYRVTCNVKGFDYSDDYAALAARSGNRTIETYFEECGWIACESRADCAKFQKLKNFRK